MKGVTFFPLFEVCNRSHTTAILTALNVAKRRATASFDDRAGAALAAVWLEQIESLSAPDVADPGIVALDRQITIATVARAREMDLFPSVPEYDPDVYAEFFPAATYKASKKKAVYEYVDRIITPFPVLGLKLAESTAWVDLGTATAGTRNLTVQSGKLTIPVFLAGYAQLARADDFDVIIDTGAEGVGKALGRIDVRFI